MNTQEKKEALVQAVEEIAGKEAAYWEGNPKMQETFQNCYVSTAKTTTKFLESGEAYVFTGDSGIIGTTKKNLDFTRVSLA